MYRQKWIGLRSVALLSTIFLLMTAGLSLAGSARACPPNGEYRFWKALGGKAAFKAVQVMRSRGVRIGADEFIALTNAGYAEIDGRATTGALDGLSGHLGVGRGDHSLIEVHSAPSSALWFAIYHKRSGFCAYLQVDPEALGIGQGPYSLKKTGCFPSMFWKRWYLSRLEYPEDFIVVLHEFLLDEGVSPKSLARPGVDPILVLESLE